MFDLFGISRRQFGLLPSFALARSERDKNMADRSHIKIGIIDVRQYGATGDGVTDDSHSINAAIDAVRNCHAQMKDYNFGCRLIFPTGIYVIEKSLNLTLLRELNTAIDGQGSVFIGRTRGAPVVDALGARWLSISNLTIVGDKDSLPSTGLQIGLLSPHEVADDHHLTDVKILGSFSTSCLYNRSGETSVFEHLLLWNDEASGYCLIQDGSNHFGITSSFARTETKTDDDLSFNENVFINCDFRHSGAGVTVWLGDTARHAFIRCYAATDGAASFILHCGSNSHTMLDVDCHCETDKLHDVFRIESKDSKVRIRGLSFIDHGCFAQHCIISAAENIQEVELQNMRMEVAGFSNRNCKVFDLATRWRVSGSFYSAAPEPWNGSGIFKGILTLGTDMRLVGMRN